jgi:putative flippase GtrA
MATTKVSAIAPFKVDLSASVLLGTLAGIFAAIVASNLGLVDQTILGLNVSIFHIFGSFLVLCVVGIIVARVVGKKIPLIYKFGKFGEAGGLNWLVDMGVLNLLILFTGLSTGIYFIIFKGISFLVSASNSYLWNKFWVFRGHKKQDETKEATKFFSATVLGLIFNVTLAGSIALVGPKIIFEIDSKVWANLATVTGSLGAMIFNFILYKIWVFKD